MMAVHEIARVVKQLAISLNKDGKNEKRHLRVGKNKYHCDLNLQYQILVLTQ